MIRSALILLVFLAVVVGGGALIGINTAPGEWYAALEKPAFNPPNWIFGPVWTALYVMIAVAGWRVWLAAPRSAAMRLWQAQLVLNFAWSPVFFSLQAPGAAFAVILVLLAAILAFIWTARRVSPLGAGLFIPYAVWVAFAAVLNGSIWLLN